MLHKVRDLIQQHALLAQEEPVWVAVSGGVDSMVLLQVLQQLGHPCSVAHVDHGLRGEESDADRVFVHTYCEAHRIPFLAHRVNVLAQQEVTGASTQMAARELRYAWFTDLAAKGPHRVATAHHADDAVETFFMGLIQGMGLNGWGSIPVRNGPFIRPLLEVRRDEIVAYARSNGIAWREDPSNVDKRYLRSRLRHDWLPMLEEWRPGTRRNLARDVRLYAELLELTKVGLQSVVGAIQPDGNGTIRVPFDRIQGHAPTLVLYHLLRDKGVHPDLYDRIQRAIAAQRTGALFHGKEYRVLVDRTELVIEPMRGEPLSWMIDDPNTVPTDAPLRITPGFHESEHGRDHRTVVVDADALVFPLELRPWRAGDRMRPLGLNGSKLVSDLLIDAKVPRDRKDRTYVLVQNKEVIWLCGHRLAEGVKTGPDTERTMILEWNGE